MGAPVSDMQAGEQPTAESLLKAFKTIDASERFAATANCRHCTTSIRWKFPTPRRAAFCSS